MDSDKNNHGVPVTKSPSKDKKNYEMIDLLGAAILEEEEEHSDHKH